MVLFGIPKQRNIRCLFGKRVMLTNDCARAERTARPIRPVLNSSLPDVWKAVRTLVTRPPDLAIAARPDDSVAKVHVELFMPLFLQLFSKQAGIGPLVKLLALLLWHTDTATVGMACRSACTCKCYSAFKSRHSST